MELSPLQLVSGAVGSAAGGGGVSAFFAWLSSRDKTQAYARGFVDKAMEGALKGVSEQLERTDHRLKTMEEEHAKCHSELSDVRNRLDESERDRAELRREIGRLMEGPVAGYEPRMPK